MHLTDPASADTDGDGLGDGEELGTYHTNPLQQDSDGDMLDDGDEVMNWHTDPLDWDAAGDDLPDGWEVEHGLDPNDDGSIDPVNGGDGDPDGDALNNEFEYWYYGNPLLADTDGDGLNDYAEVFVHFTWPDLADCDADGLNDHDEVITYGTEPWLWDTDDDTLSDGDEVLTHGTSPLDMDTDGDWMWDDWELDNNLNPSNAADGLLDADGDTLANQLEFAFLAQGYDPFGANNAAAFPWADDPDCDGLTTQVEFVTYLTNPTQPDTDEDTMDDGWEVSNGLDPKLCNILAGPANHHPSDDPDGDGLTNAEEAQLSTNPNDPDTDGDLVNDDVEESQGSNPRDPNDKTPPPDGTVPVILTFGDHSGSHSEKYRLLLSPVDGDTQVRQRSNNRYGEVQSWVLNLPRGAKYTVTLTHIGTDERYRDQPNPDYDYTLEIPQLAPESGTIRVLNDPDDIGGTHDESEEFFADEKSMELGIMNFQTQTVAQIPSNVGRRKLGVREQAFVSVTPNMGDLTWSLPQTVDASVTAPDGYFTMFIADSRISTTIMRASFASGETYEISWDVVEPTGEVAVKTSETAFAAGTQGAGMTLEITTQPTDVSFYRVQVREIDMGTSNVTGFFVGVPANLLAHNVKPDWIPLSFSNTWADEAGFSGWGNPATWAHGTYQWDIEVRWRTAGEEGPGLPLANRIQLHTLHDATGSSTESKLGQSATRTP